ncbi:hypothetical protein DIPPA_20389 [Diplonema papillatum]|nr:hypothetical protein DIPPA_20389 [Diplonema papillatum]
MLKKLNRRVRASLGMSVQNKTFSERMSNWWKGEERPKRQKVCGGRSAPRTPSRRTPASSTAGPPTRSSTRWNPSTTRSCPTGSASIVRQYSSSTS